MNLVVGFGPSLMMMGRTGTVAKGIQGYILQRFSSMVSLASTNLMTC